MDLYKDLGFLILGSRLRRLSEYYLSEVNKVYRSLDIPFEASWFPVFYILSGGAPVSITYIADALVVSHSAVSQLIKNLKEKKLVETLVAEADRRHQMVQLSKDGLELLVQLKPVWNSISGSLDKLGNRKNDISHFLPALEELENQFRQRSLSEIIIEKIK